MPQPENKLIQLITILALFITIGLTISILIPTTVIIFFFPLGVIYNGYLDFLFCFTSILIFLRANHIYSNTLNPKKAIMAGGFLAGAIIYAQGYLFFSKYQPQFNELIAILTWALTAFMSVYYFPKNPDNSKNFRRNIYAILLLYAVGVSVLDRVLIHYYIDYTYKIIPNIPFLYITAQTMYLLASYAYMDIKKTEKMAVLSNFNLGLLWMGIIPLFVYSIFGTTLFAVLQPIIRTVGFLLLLTGINDIPTKHTHMSFRQKFTSYLLVFLLTSYTVFIPMASITLDIKFPLFSQYLFFGFFISTILLQYFTSNIFIKPIVNITKGMEDYSPDKAPKKIPTISNDEISDLTGKINTILESNWNYTNELISKQKQIMEYADREALLRKIIEKIRSSLDINETLTFICYEVAKLFNVQRATITAPLDKKHPENIVIRSEYTLDKSIMSIGGRSKISKEDGDALHHYWYKKVVENNKIYQIDNISEFEESDLIKNIYEHMGVKSIIGIPIISGDDRWGGLYLSEYNDNRLWNDKDKKLLEAIADQTYMAIKQAELYETTKKQAERESLLRKVIETIRSTLDVNEIKKTVISEITKIFNPDRTFIIEFDYSKKNKYIPISKDYEYLASEDIESFAGFDFSSTPGFDFIQKLHKEKKDMFYNDIDKYLEQNNLVGSDTENYLRKFKNEALMAINITYGNELIGNLVISYTKKQNFTEDDIQFLKTIANQIGIAFHQSKLYETVKNNAEKERILREIVSELKPFQKTEDAFEYLLAKIASIYNAPRTVLVEIPLQENENPYLGYEYRKEENMPAIKNGAFPKAFIQMFKNIIKTHSQAIVSDTKKLHPEDIEIQNFFKTYSIGSFIGSPLIRYNHEINLLGILFIGNEPQREWEENDIELLKSINESVVNVIWEILKTIEVNRLRDTFVNTLAHDLQVPIVGDIKALEFIESRPETQQIGTCKEIMAEISNNDKRILEILKSLLASYQYESGKKILEIKKTDFNRLINQTIDDQKDMVENKEISIETNFPEDLELNVDRKEIYKIFCIFLNNAIKHTPKNGKIKITATKGENNVEFCVEDNGSGIPEHMKDLIFKRYEMSVELERKIGAGISLYLAKLIVKAHSGDIWFKTETGKGSKFCFSLPL